MATLRDTPVTTTLAPSQVGLVAMARPLPRRLSNRPAWYNLPYNEPTIYGRVPVGVQTLGSPSVDLRVVSQEVQ